MDQDLQTWDTGSDAYVEVSGHNDAFKELIDDPAFMNLLGDVNGKQILDIGCGDGLFCKRLHQKGALTTGVDGSPRMISHAQANDHDTDYRVADVLQPLPFEQGSFDVVTAKMMLMNLGSIDTVAHNVYAVLKDGGLFAIDVVHPFLPTIKALKEVVGHKYKGLDDYLKESRGTIRFNNVEYSFYYRPMSSYIRSMLQAGFTLRECNELGITDELADKYPEQKSKANQPIALHLLFQK